MELVKHYDSDWAKAKSRDLVGKMLDKTILTFRKPKDVKVLHFGGVDLAEAKQVYLPRGIKPENIVSIERDRASAEAQRKLGLGVQVVNQDIVDYAKSEDINFDVISLDYIGPITTKTLDILAMLSDKQKNNQFLLHHANLLRRDGDSERVYMTGYSFRDAHKFDSDPGFKPSHHIRKGFEKMQEMRREFDSALEGDGIKDIKSLGYTPVLRALLSRTTIGSLNKLFRFSSGNDFLFNIRNLEKIASEDWKKEVKIDPNDVTGSLINLSGGNPAMSKLVEYLISLNIEGMMSNMGLGSKESLVATMALADYVKNKPYFKLVDFEGYSYISESGAPMIGDIMFLRYPQYLDMASEDITRSLTNPIKLVSALRQYSRASNKFCPTESLKLISQKIDNRSFLGNSSKPILTKGRAIEEFEKGKSVEEIQQIYRGWQNKPLSQWKAHYTMGTYTGNNRSVEIEESSLEKLTKEDALDLLSSGIPTKEIVEAWPGSFTVGQLNSYKAHITMGTYEGVGK